MCHVDISEGEIDPDLIASVRDAVEANQLPDLIDFVLEGNLGATGGLFQQGFEGYLTAEEIEAILEFVASIEQ